LVAGFRRYCVYITAIGPLLIAGTVESRAGDDGKICAQQSGDVAIEACSRAITSGRYKGHAQATNYVNRGAEWKLKKEYDRAFADQSEAIRIDAAYADAFYNSCIVYNIREDYDHAFADCSRAIELGPTAAATSSTGVRLGDDRAKSDYYAERGFSYLKKKDYDHAIADLDNAIRLYHKSARSFRNRGLAYEAKGDAARAQVDFETAKQLDK
jgi:tetratricopeptide (TPR) repeat protein